MLSLLRSFLTIPPREVEISQRGFSCSDPCVQTRLENIGRVFLKGYHAAIDHKNQLALAESLDQIESEDRGFAFEGAAMALTLLDGITLSGNAFSHFAAGAGKSHIFMLHVGAGWAYARLPWKRHRIESIIRLLHPVLGWLVIDGYGFHEGYFHGKTRAANPASQLSEHARHVFYQGLGRSLWFVNGADVLRISDSISIFPKHYKSDVWSGVGLACAYAGGISADQIAELRRLAGEYADALAQGAAFAAKARLLAGNPAKHTNDASVALCSMRSEQAAALCDETFRQINLIHPCPYQHWRELLQKALVPSAGILKKGKCHETQYLPPVVATKSY
ncbi:MAG: DUF1702 family protein [Candidatus Angelobacter sp.]